MCKPEADLVPKVDGKSENLPQTSYSSLEAMKRGTGIKLMDVPAHIGEFRKLIEEQTKEAQDFYHDCSNKLWCE